MFNVKVLKRPSRTTSSVLNVFTKTLSELEAVATEHEQYAQSQQEVADAAASAAAEALHEVQTARDSIRNLNNALGIKAHQ